MPEPTPLAKRIAELNELRDDPDSARAAQALRDALADRSAPIVVKAAELCYEFCQEELVPDLLQAYQRMFLNPLKRDPGCQAKTAIAHALLSMDTQDIEPYRRGIKYQQYEPVWGGQEDTAAQLRAVCAAGMASCATCMEALSCFADLLADPCKPARLGAVQAIASLGHWEAEQAILCCLCYLLFIRPRDPPGDAGEVTFEPLLRPDPGTESSLAMQAEIRFANAVFGSVISETCEANSPCLQCHWRRVAG